MKKPQFFILTFGALAFLIILHNLGFLKIPERFLVNIFSPVGKVLNISTNSGKGILGSIRGLKNLEKENKDLRERLNESEAEIVNLQEAKAENDSLRKELAFKQSTDLELISANIVMYDTKSVKQTIVIDKGEKDGLKSGMIILSEGFLVGKIYETRADISKAYLVTDISSAIPAYVQNSTATGSVKGKLGYGMSLEMIPQGDVLKQGQLVITSGLGGEYPKGLIIGKIDNVDQGNNSTFQSASIRPEVNFKFLERVMVVIK